MGCRRVSSEQIAVHHFAGRVLGLALPPIDALFSPIHQVVSPADKYSRGKLHPDKGKPTLHLPAAKEGRRTSTELLLVNTLTGRSRRTSAEGSYVATPMGMRGSRVARFGTMTTDLQVIESVTSRSPKSPDFANFYLPASCNPQVKVKTMATITVLSPTSHRKISHFPSKSEGLYSLHRYTSKSPQPSANMHNDSNASATLASGTEEILSGLYQESTQQMHMYAKRYTKRRAQKLQELSQYCLFSAISRVTHTALNR